TFHVPGMSYKIHLGLHSAAGRASDSLAMKGTPFEGLHRAGWDATARVEAQQADGIDGEVIYPSVGMLLCNHPDLDLKKAMFDAYNRWIADYCSVAPDRLYGCGQTALRTPAEGIADLEVIKAAGLRGVMLPGTPGTVVDDGREGDYDDPIWDEFFTAANDLGLVLSFHILTGKSYRPRGPKLNSFMSIIRGNQDLIGTFIFGGVFDRHPDLRIVCVEADAGWVPHYSYRMDHAYNRHRNWLTGTALERKPSEYFADHVYVTFQDDWSAFRMAEAGLIETDRLLWANDYPHSDSTWPYSQHMLADQTAGLSDESRAKILGGNTVELYGLQSLFT
ncbi:MAG: amidohydrolase family protein, partial [Actinomycetota bacterium]